MRVQLLGSFNKEYAYEKAMQNPGEYIDIFTKDESDTYDPNAKDMEIEDTELTRRGSFMHVDDESRQRYLFIKEYDGFALYKILPNVKESHIYHWKERASCKSKNYSRLLWTQIKTSLMRFNITFHVDIGLATIVVTIGGDAINYINIENATNDKITDAINSYIIEFKQEANNVKLIDAGRKESD